MVIGGSRKSVMNSVNHLSCVRQVTVYDLPIPSKPNMIFLKIFIQSTVITYCLVPCTAVKGGRRNSVMNSVIF